MSWGGGDRPQRPSLETASVVNRARPLSHHWCCQPNIVQRIFTK